jgi:hypothetical protein
MRKGLPCIASLTAIADLTCHALSIINRFDGKSIQIKTATIALEDS